MNEGGMMRAWLVLTILVALPNVGNTQSAKGSDTSLQIGGIDLSLGMSQDDALTALGRLYDVRNLEGAPGSWIVVRRGTIPLEILGSVAFAKGQVVLVSKQWGPFDANYTAPGFAQAVFSALSSQNGNTCIVTADSRPNIRSITLKCPSRSYELYSPDGAAATVTETIRR